MMSEPLTRATLVAMLLLPGTLGLWAAEPESAARPVKNLILPGESFVVDGRPAFIFWPAEEKRQTPQPWILYGPTLPAYPDSHEKWMHEQFLAAGIAVAGIDVGEAYGSPTGQKHFTALYQELTAKRGFARKPCLLGRSRGGLWVSSWAIRNADKVAGLAGIYPVFDLRTYPGLKRAAPAYAMTPQELEASLDQHNPIAQIDVLAKARLPVFIIHGDLDKVVPLKENSKTLVDRYREANAGDLVQLVVAEGQGHNFWPGFFRCQELVDFAIQRARRGCADDGGQEEQNGTENAGDPVGTDEDDGEDDGDGESEESELDSPRDVEDQPKESLELPGAVGEWHGFRRHVLDVDGKQLTVVAPRRPAKGRPWVWHGEFFGHKPGVGHHPHGLKDPAPIVQFILRHSGPPVRAIR